MAAKDVDWETSRLVPRDEKQRLFRLPDDNDDDTVNKWSGAFYFVQAADTQFGLIDSYIKRVEPISWDEEIALSESLVAKCNRVIPKPKFLVVCGDLIDAMPSTDLRPAQLNDWKRVYSKLDKSIPLVCVCGNHDIGNEPTMDSIESYKREFKSEDYYYFVTAGVLFIVLNSQFYEHRANVESYARQQDRWFEEVLEKCKHYKHSILFEHIPWFLTSFDEDDQYFNINRELRLHWLRKIRAAGVTKIFCGHYHRNAGGWFEGLELVVTSAVGGQLGDDKSGVRLVWVRESGVEHQYFGLEELPARVDLERRQTA